MTFFLKTFGIPSHVDFIFLRCRHRFRGLAIPRRVTRKTVGDLASELEIALPIDEEPDDHEERP